MTDARTVELDANLQQVRAQIVSACGGAGRSPDEVTLVAVTKTWPAEDIRRLAGLGVHDVAENRDQEAAEKSSTCAGIDVRWHFVGQLQTNKVRSVVRYADVVQTVDRPRLVSALDRAAVEAGRRLVVLVQVTLAEIGDRDPARGGAAPDDVASLCDAIAACEALDLGGVMGVAPLAGDPAVAFARLGDVASAVRASHPAATWVSAGMSQDFAIAIDHGATHVRVGSALLGNRPALR